MIFLQKHSATQAQAWSWLISEFDQVMNIAKQEEGRKDKGGTSACKGEIVVPPHD